MKRARELAAAILNLGLRGHLALTPKDRRWYYTLDKETYIGPYKRRVQAERAYVAHMEIRG